MSARRLHAAPPELHLSPDEEAAWARAEAGLTEDSDASIAAQHERELRMARALQEAWQERARCHELLTSAQVPPGDLVQRVLWVLAQLAAIKATPQEAL